MSRRIIYNEELSRIEVEFPFDWDLKDFVKAIPGSRFDGAAKVWHFPKASVKIVVRKLVTRDFEVGATIQQMLEEREDEEEARGLRISELNAAANRALRETFSTSIWIVGEISDFRGASSNGHAYFQLVETDEQERVVATVQAVAFRDSFRLVERELKEQELDFENGLEIAVLADVGIYSRGGSYQLIIQDIDAGWSRKQLAEKREKILRQLQDEGLDQLNLDLPLVEAPQRIALVTAHKSEAFHDFITTIEQSGFSFDVTYFDVRVQGEGLEDSVLQALALIRANADRFDVCVICRGGGSRTELGSWDNLAVARAVAKLPLKVVVGIGHQRDRSVLDDIALSTKTPTAAAELLIERLAVIWNDLIAREERIPHVARQAIRYATSGLERRAARLRLRTEETFGSERQKLRSEIPLRLRNAARRVIERAEFQLERFGTMVRPAAVRRLLRSERERLDSRVHQLADRADRERAREEQVLDDFCGRLRVRADRRLRAEGDRLDSLARAVRSSDPKQVLRRGFAIVRDGDGGVLRAAERAASERELRIQFHEGVLRLPVSEDSEVSEE